MDFLEIIDLNLSHKDDHPRIGQTHFRKGLILSFSTGIEWLRRFCPSVWCSGPSVNWVYQEYQSSYNTQNPSTNDSSEILCDWRSTVYASSQETSLYTMHWMLFRHWSIIHLHPQQSYLITPLLDTTPADFY